MTSSCIKTAEQLKREKKFEAMSEQLSDSQNIVTDLMSQIKLVQNQLDLLNGRLEEVEFKQKQVDPSSLKSVSEDISIIKNQREADSKDLLEIKNQIKDQQIFLEKITKSLSQISTNKNSNQNGKKKTAKDELIEALSLVKKNKYDQSKPLLLELLNSNELSAGDMNKALHALGKIEYQGKNFDQALVYFSKVYSKYPKSSLAPSSLFFIGKSLKTLGKTEEAKEAFVKLTEDYPQSRESSDAKKEL